MPRPPESAPSVGGVLLDCQACGACCAFSCDWPELRSEVDLGPGGPPAALRTEDGYMRCQDDRCVALEGVVGAATACSIYARRPAPCRGLMPGEVGCIQARVAHGLPVPEQASTMDGWF